MQSEGRTQTRGVLRQPVPALCRGCLSSDRELSSIGEFVNIYRSLCETKTPAGRHLTDICFCWECTAMLKRFQMFRKQVKHAQTLFDSVYNDFKKTKSLPKPLSRLNVTKTNQDYITLHEPELEIKPLERTITKYNQDYMVLKEPELDVKPEIIKEEINPDEDFENTDYFDDNNDFTYLEDIKSEDPTLIIKLKKLKKEKTVTQYKKKTFHYYYIKSPEKLIMTEQARQPVFSELWERDRLKLRGSQTNCEMCMKVFSEDESIETHNRKYHDEHIGPHVCEICHIRYSNQDELASHITSHNMYCCVVCSHRCLNMEDAVSHASRHKRVVKCKLCRYYCLKVKPNYFAHYKSMHIWFVCDHCGKKCKDKQVLRRHITRHHMDLKCNSCGLKFSNYRSFQNHTATVHETDRSGASFCVKCNIQFQNRIRFRRHLNSSSAHAQEKQGPIKREPIKCLLCDNRYSRRTYMMNHYRFVHMAKTKYYCQECDKYFMNSSKRAYHRRHVHEGVELKRDKLCSVCGRGFTYFLTRTGFLNHRRHHDGTEKKRDKLCSVCGRGFTTNRILTNHMRTHTGERPFECGQCDARFAQRVARDTHRRRHNRDNADIR